MTELWEPFITEWTPSAGGGTSVLDNASGFYADIMDILAKRLGFRVSIQGAPSGASWSQLVEVVANRTVDFGLTGYSQTFARFKKVRNRSQF